MDYHQRWGQPKGNIYKICDPTTFILAILSSQALGATSVTQDPISLIFQAQQFYLSSTEAKTGN